MPIGSYARRLGRWPGLLLTALIAVLPADSRADLRPRSGDDLIGRVPPEWTAGPEWEGSKPLRLQDLRGRVVMVRFWTDTCPYCAASLPAMQRLADEFAEKDVTFIGLYHSKPRGSERPWSQAVARAKELGVRFPIAYDHQWKTVRRWWLDGRERSATSSSFIIGRDGKIAFVHPGPAFFPRGDAVDEGPNEDFEAIRAAIGRALRKPR